MDTLDRLEVERLLTLGELDAVQVDCGGGITEWVGPPEACRLWPAVEADLIDVQADARDQWLVLMTSTAQRGPVDLERRLSPVSRGAWIASARAT
mgnify:FL=1